MATITLNPVFGTRIMDIRYQGRKPNSCSPGILRNRRQILHSPEATFSRFHRPQVNLS